MIPSALGPPSRSGERHPGQSERGEELKPEQVTLNEESSQDRTRHCKDPLFLEKFKACENLDSLRRLAVQANIDLRSYSRLAFRQLVVSQEPLEVLLGFLDDPLLDDPKARNLKFLLDLQVKQCEGDNDTISLVAVIAPWIKTQLSLGKISEEGVTELANFVCRVGTATNEESTKCRLAAAIFDGLESSSILGLNDLKMSTRNVLFKSITQGVFSWQSWDLGCKVFGALHSANLRVNHVSILIQRSFQSQVSTDETEKHEAWHLDTVARSLQLLETFPQNTARTIIQITSSALIDRNKHLPVSGKAFRRLLTEWWSALAKSDFHDFAGDASDNSEKIERMMVGQKLEVLVPYLRHVSDHRKARVMLRHWFTPRVGKDEMLQMVEHFEKDSRKHEVPEPFVSMLRAVYARSLLTNAFIGRVFRLLRHMSMSNVVTEISKLQNEPFTIDPNLVLQTIKKEVKLHPKQAHRLFQLDERMPLEGCPEIAELMINDLGIHHKTVWWYRRRRQLKSQNLFAIHPEKLRQARKKLLERMALAFAGSSYLSDRQAFREVYLSYLRHHIDGHHSLGIETSRALTQSGITRQLENDKWVSTEKLRWILSIVRREEGAQASDEADQIAYMWRGEVARRIGQRLRLAGPMRLASPELKGTTHVSET